MPSWCGFVPLPIDRGVVVDRSALQLHPRDSPAEVRLQLQVADVQIAPLQPTGRERPVGVLDQLIGELVGRLGVLLGERLDAPPRAIGARTLAALDDPDRSVRANVYVV